MTLEEAIKHCEEVADSKERQVANGDWEKGVMTEHDCIECAEEHRQLAEWLKDYKRLKEQDLCDDAISRQAVLDKIREVCFSIEQEWVDFRVSQGSNGQRDLIISFIEDLPSIQPKAESEG